ncbi:glycine oxidase ThiO [Thalassotalea fonticola]|uniref:D-amino-acid oxidase n=1 Tax=Thalassotalea fonticola TaxID=3065649 RepID=A0ABZ0GP27_9GAMM|nr:glycine oxidase ThiO [Colwelliaceae bacterium S1-1]
MANIAIVGAGLMGRLAALFLHRQGEQVTLFDKDQKKGELSAARAAAGLLTPLGESLHCEENIVAMGFKSLTLWPEILASLNGYNFFQQQGSLLVSHAQDNGDFQRFSKHLQRNYAQHPCHLLNREQINELEPELGRSFNRALYLPEEGQIGNRKLLLALQQQLEDEQVNWLTNHYVKQINGDTLQVNGESQQFDLIIDCRGTGAIQAACNTIGALSDLRAVRGELFQLYAPDIRLQRPIRLMHPRYQLYIAPKGKGHFVVGATEIESDDMGPMTVRSSLELLSAAYSIHPSFAEAQIRQHVVGTRPAFSDNQPQIKVSNQLIQVNGLFRHGFLIAPVLLKQLLKIVAHIKQTKPLAELYNLVEHPELIQLKD